MRKMGKRDKQTIRLLKWIKQYPGWWQLICTPNDGHMNVKMMRTLIGQLARARLYEIIFVLLMVHREESYVKDLSSTMLLDLITENWSGKGKRKGRERLIEDMLEYLN